MPCPLCANCIRRDCGSNCLQNMEKTTRRPQFTLHCSTSYHRVKSTRSAGAGTAINSQSSPPKRLFLLGFSADNWTRWTSGAQWAQLRRLSGWRWKATHYFLLHHTVGYSWGPAICGELGTVQDDVPLPLLHANAGLYTQFVLSKSVFAHGHFTGETVLCILSDLFVPSLQKQWKGSF